MAPEKSEKPAGISGRLKAIFRSKKNTQKDLTGSSDTNLNDEPGNAILQTTENEGSGSGIIRNDQSNAGGDEHENATNEDISITLWNDAYDNLRNGSDEDKKKLIETYEKLLTKMTSQELSVPSGGGALEEDSNRFQYCNSSTRIKEMQSAVEIILKETEKHSKARSYAIQGVDIFDNVKETISQALASYPPAALAFSGLCVSLPFLIKPLKQTKAMADGLVHILESLTWYMALSRLLLKDFKLGGDFAEFRNVLKDRVVALYQNLLEYQIKCAIRRFHTGRTFRSLKAIIGLEDWDGSSKDFLKLEEAFKADAMAYNNEAIKGLAAQSNDNEKDIVNELRKSNQQRQQEMTGRFNSGCKGYMERNNPKPVEGTCVWFTSHDSFQVWTDDESNLLVVSADPGCGKSVLSRHLVESVLPGIFPNWFICHFFFKDVGEQRDLSTGLSCIIHQLLSQTESLPEPAKKAIIEAGDVSNNWRTLWEILLLLLRETDNVIILFDALDEMDPEKFQELTTKLKEELLPTSSTGSNTKFLVTTRPYDVITKPLKLIQSNLIHLQGEGKNEIDEIQGEIKLVVQHRFQEFKKNHLHLEDHVVKALEDSLERKGKDQKTYLWVNLAFELLDTDKSYLSSERHWKGLVDSISKGHIEIYEKLLQHVSIEDKENVRIVLSLLISKSSPWTTKELDIALAVRNKFLLDPNFRYKDEKSLDCRGDMMADWIRNTCRCFVTVYDSKVYFIHQTAKEFLVQLKTTSEVQPSIQCWHESISLRQAKVAAVESWIACTCIEQYTGFDEAYREFADHSLIDPLLEFRDCQIFERSGTTTSNEGSTMKVLDVSEPFQSSYYALWDQSNMDQSHWLAEMCYWNCYEYSLFNFELGNVFETQEFHAFDIIIASFFGQYNILVRLVNKYRDLDDTDMGKAVTVAAFGGNLECLAYLLSQGYPTNTSFEIPKQVEDRRPPTSSDAYFTVFGRTALHWAAIWGTSKMAQLLLKNGAKVDVCSQKDGQRPVVDAIRDSWTGREISRKDYLGHVSHTQELRTSRKLLTSGCDKTDWDESLLKIFVENGANLDDAFVDKSILYHAVECKDENAVGFLLQRCGVDPNKGVHDDHGETPLHLALEDGSHRICMLLLEAGADASILCNIPIQSLWAMAINVSALYVYLNKGKWNDNLLTALLESGGSKVINAKIDFDGVFSDNVIPDYYDAETRFDWQSVTCFNCLISNICRSNVHLDASCVEKLVHYGADVNEPNDVGQTPLHYACSVERMSRLAIMLLGFGADPTLKDVSSKTPLDMVQDTEWFNSVPDDRRKFLESCEAHIKRLSWQTTE